MEPEQDTIREMARTLGVLSRRAQRAFRLPGRDTGLSPVQGVVLVHLEESPLPVGVLADKCGAAQNTMSEIVRRMREHGLVDKTRDDKDQRVVLVAMTSKGKKTLERQRELITKLHEGLLRNLKPEQRSTLMESITTLVELMEIASSKAQTEKKRK